MIGKTAVAGLGCGGVFHSAPILSSTHFLYRWAVVIIGVEGRLFVGEKTSADGLRDAGVDDRELSKES